MIGNLPVALGTQQFHSWYNSLLTVMIIVVAIGFTVSILGSFAPKKIPKHLLIIPVVASILFLGTFDQGMGRMRRI